MQKILIFGGTGFIGQSLANHLQEKGFTPILVARNQPDPSIKHQFLQGCVYLSTARRAITVSIVSFFIANGKAT